MQMPADHPVPFVVLITGSRAWTDRDSIEKSLLRVTKDRPFVKIVHGGAKGADQIAHQIAIKHGWQYKVYTPDWHNLGRGAGLVRNSDMIKNEKRVDIVMAFPTKESRGTLDMISKAKKAGLRVEVDRTKLV